MIHYLYKITNNINGMYYIGVHSTEDINDGYMGSGTGILAAIEEQGTENFTKEILEYCDSREELMDREAEIVTAELVKDPNCYNRILGGYGWRKKIFTKEEQKEKVRKYYREHKDYFQEIRRLYEQEHKEERAAHYKTYYETHREERLEWQRKYAQEHKEEIKEYRKTESGKASRRKSIKKWTENNKEKIQEYMREYNRKYNKTEEQKAYRREYQKKRRERIKQQQTTSPCTNAQARDLRKYLCLYAK